METTLTSLSNCMITCSKGRLDIDHYGDPTEMLCSSVGATANE